MAGLIERLTGFTMRHPVVGGLALVVVGVLMVGDSMEGAREFHELERARELPAQVMSVSESTVLPPRYEVVVAWIETGEVVEATVGNLGQKTAEKLEVGESVQILILEDGSVKLAMQRPTNHPIRVAGVEAMPLVYVGATMSVCGVIIALFGKRLFS